MALTRRAAAALIAGLVLGLVACVSRDASSPRAPAPTPGGWSSVTAEDDKVKAAAKHAVAAQALASGAQLQLVSVRDSRRQVVAGINYELALLVLKDGKVQSAKAVVWGKLDGTYTLTAWSWE